MEKKVLKTFIIMCFFLANLNSEPPREIPFGLLDEFTMNKMIPVVSYYLDTTSSDEKAYFYSFFSVDEYIEQVLRREPCYYGITDDWLFKLLDRNPEIVRDKVVAVMGSYKPWYEAVILAYGGKPHTIEYNKIETDDERLTLETVDEFDENPRKFDAIISISSFEHDGLGRYGDPIDPNGDLHAMEKCRNMLNPNGKLILAVPVGRDCLAWNAHRIYGPKRMPSLLTGWKVVDDEGFSRKLFKTPLGVVVQPVFLLEPN